MTAIDLHELFLATLLRQLGGTRRRWRIVLGDVRLYSRATHPHCNWAITPSGSAEENGAIERIADALRTQHPVVTR